MHRRNYNKRFIFNCTHIIGFTRVSPDHIAAYDNTCISIYSLNIYLLRSDIFLLLLREGEESKLNLSTTENDGLTWSPRHSGETDCDM